MCGIAGVVDVRGGATRHLEAQLRTLAHRGPDSSGVYEGGRARIGQTRLAIIDLVGGDPPITNEDGSIGVVLNGEIYNFTAIQEQLRSQGHELKTECDTEVIAHLAEDLEPVEVARRLDGMFAFATWDTARSRLVLGRDRLGKKPLYYWTGPGRLVFGSEIKALLAHPDVPRQLDPAAIPAYLTFGYVPTPATFFEGIRSVPPGHVLVMDDAGVRIERYWSPPTGAGTDAPPLDLPLEELAALVRDGLSAAVGRRLRADVPLGAFLSGGIDSSSIVALMARMSERQVSTFTIGFDDTDGFDERPYARIVAQRYGTDHHEFVVKPDAAALVERLVWHHDQPFGDSSALPTFLLSELTRGTVTVALCGDGGDELFGGYERFAAGIGVDRYGRTPPAIRAAVEAMVHRAPDAALRGRKKSLERFLAASSPGLPRAFLSWVSYVPDKVRAGLLRTSDGWGFDDYDRIWGESDGAGVLDRLLLQNLRTYLLDDLLPKVDRMSMAHGLEVRSPFLDTELVELAFRLPAGARVRGFSLKRVLKASMKDLLPPEIVGRRKRGFGVPLDRWFRSDLLGYVGGTLGASDARVRAHLRPEGVDRLLAEHGSGAANHGHALWTLLTLEVFLRREGW